MSSRQKQTINKERFSYSVMSDEELDGLHFDILEVPQSSKILDTRSIDNFKTTVFSGPLKSKVMGALDKSIAEEKLEAANYWAFQLLFSGHINALFDKLISIAAKQINIANPHLPTFILKKTIEWEKLTSHKVYEKKMQIKLRNNQEMRHLIVEIVSLLTLSMYCWKDLKPIFDGDSDLKIAMKMIAQTQKGPDEQIPSMGCNIKWFK